MRLIGLVLLLALCLFLEPLSTEAQSPAGKSWRIGVLLSLFPPDADPPQALRQGLRMLGYVEGQNLVIDWRYAQGRDERLPDLAAELVKLKVELIVADITLAVRAAMRASSTIPIVMAVSADAVGSGLVGSLARPGGNVTGLSVLLAETSVKRLQLLKEAVPKISRVAVLWDPATPFHRTMLKEVDAASPSLRIQPFAIAVKSRDDLGSALSDATKVRADALFVSQGMSPTAQRQLLDFAAKKRLPTMYLRKEHVSEGGLMSYAPSFSEMFQHSATYVDKIFNGAKPADLPVEQPTKFELVINLKTARALGLTIPQTLLLRADQVIE
jgi:putative tryptophan/tyrosine transport system substrate-binding protein